MSAFSKAETIIKDNGDRKEDVSPIILKKIGE
jgi:hypothetical protein